MKKTKIFAGICAGILTFGFIAASNLAGSSTDPLISRSYIEDNYLNKISNMTISAIGNTFETINGQIDPKANKIVETAFSSKTVLAQKMAGIMGISSSQLDVKTGDVITTQLGTELSVLTGGAKLSSGALFNLTTGKLVSIGGTLSLNHRYLTSDGGATILITSAGTACRLLGNYTTSTGGTSDTSGYVVRYETYANALNSLGLFQGTDLGYQLEQQPTRVQGVIMLIRLLGEEEAALASTAKHPFTDVPSWADHYVAYAFRKGYTVGVSQTQFGPSNNLRWNDYMTFLLRALSYQDSAGDFAWATALETAANKGILTEAEKGAALSTSKLYRDDMVYASYKALFVKKKNSSLRLCDSLISKGVFTQTMLENAQWIVS